MIDTDIWFEATEFVPSEKFKGFLECKLCRKGHIESWKKDFYTWNFCPVCGHPIRKGERNGEL